MTDLGMVSRLAFELDDGDRQALAHMLIASLPDNTRLDEEEAWEEEIQRRLAELDSGLSQPIPGHEVMARLRAIVDAASI